MYKRLLLPLLAVILFAACHSSTQTGTNQPANYTPPMAGTIIAMDSTPINDPLNHFSFSVKIIATQYSKSGTYDVVAAWGPDVARSSFTMPQGAGNLKPILQKGKGPDTYIIGFHYGDASKFYDYYEIDGAAGNIGMKYLKGYSFSNSSSNN